MDGLKKDTVFYPKFFAFRQTQNGNVKFNLVILFVFSIFLLGDTLKIASMNAASIVAMLMAGIFLLVGFTKGHLSLQRYPLQKPLFLLLLWAVISLLISKIDPS